MIKFIPLAFMVFCAVFVTVSVPARLRITETSRPPSGIEPPEPEPMPEEPLPDTEPMPVPPPPVPPEPEPKPSPEPPPTSVPIDSIESRRELGRNLYHDKLLSADGSRSCATCHDPGHGYASKGLPLSVHGKPLRRKAPTLVNRAYGSRMDWDGGAESLTAKTLAVMDNREEMGDVASAVARTSQNERYREAFSRLYGTLDKDTLAAAVVAYVESIKSGRGKFDDYLDGIGNPLTAKEVKGFNLFRGKANCYQCHLGPNLTDERFHNTGIGAANDTGRYAVTKDKRDYGAFKTPTLRGVKDHAPYGHDCKLETLEAVIRFYNRGGRANPNLSLRIEPLGLTDTEVDELAAFLRVL